MAHTTISRIGCCALFVSKLPRCGRFNTRPATPSIQRIHQVGEVKFGSPQYKMDPGPSSRKRSASHPTLSFPIIFLLPANLGPEELQDLEDQIPTLTFDINEAEVVLGKVFRKERAEFELRKLGLTTEEVSSSELSSFTTPSKKRPRRTSPPLASSDIDSDTASEGEIQRRLAGKGPLEPIIKVVKLPWFTESIKAGEVLPIENYVVYSGRKVSRDPASASQPSPVQRAAGVMERALADAASKSTPFRPSSSHSKRAETTHATQPVRPTLRRQTTSEQDKNAHLPPIPDFLHTTYSCQRPTPVHPPNEDFIEELEKIRTARTLTGDKIGVRAYSTAIATIAAYPYKFQTAQGMDRIKAVGSLTITRLSILTHAQKWPGSQDAAIKSLCSSKSSRKRGAFKRPG
jgi:DNA polymerase IV